MKLGRSGEKISFFFFDVLKFYSWYVKTEAEWLFALKQRENIFRSLCPDVLEAADNDLGAAQCLVSVASGKKLVPFLGEKDARLQALMLPASTAHTKSPGPDLTEKVKQSWARLTASREKSRGRGRGGRANKPEFRLQLPPGGHLREANGWGWLGFCLGTSHEAERLLVLAHSILSLTHSFIYLSTHFFIHFTKVFCTRHSFVVFQLLNHVQLFVTPWTAAHQAPLSSTISQRLLKFMSIELLML